MEKLNKEVFFIAIRQLIYTLFILALILGVRGLSYYYQNATFSEDGIIESLQLCFLALSGTVFVVSGFQYKADKSLFFIFAALAFFAMCRELDHFCDHHVPIISWKFAFLFPIVALWNGWKKRGEVVQSLNYFLSSPTFYLMVLAVVIALPVAQAVGDKRLVGNVMGGERIHDIKELFEEMCEFVGYFTLFLSSVEAFFWWRKDKIKN